jgi:hypothetical protein
MKTIVEMTREAGGFDATPEFLERFEALVRADEREACAKVLADRANHIENNHRRPHYGFPYELRQSIAAIRARGNT